MKSIMEDYKNCPVCDDVNDWIHISKDMCSECSTRTRVQELDSMLATQGKAFKMMSESYVKLEDKVKWQAGMLEEAKLIMQRTCVSTGVDLDDEHEWLAKLAEFKAEK